MYIDRLINGWWNVTWYIWDVEKGYIDYHYLAETRAEAARFMYLYGDKE